ncbi:hypothetical protein [Bosea sp. MMO-172]|uniref:hypothetical protein n=1 Tax=Bosea sp. MMO-172 TaxID=3127885 RepID=UPI003019D8DE
MKLSAEQACLIAAALADGRLRVIPEGLRGLPMPIQRPTDHRCRPEGCGAGRMLSRLPGIDAYDRGPR